MEYIQHCKANNDKSPVIFKMNLFHCQSISSYHVEPMFPLTQLLLPRCRSPPSHPLLSGFAEYASTWTDVECWKSPSLLLTVTVETEKVRRLRKSRDGDEGVKDYRLVSAARLTQIHFRRLSLIH